jgi:Acylphosphatases
MDQVLEVVVRGRVQGVGFRYFVQREAIELGLTGWVANEPDGAVRCVAAGPRAVLEAFAERLRQGPPSASVGRLEFDWRPLVGQPYDSFRVRTGAHRGD